MKTESISLTESKRLIHLEKQIKESVFSAGQALKEIRDGKLYRSAFSTFEEYCSDKWGYTRQRGYQLIEAFEVSESLPENVKQCLTNDRQASALSKIPKPQRPAVLKDIKASGEKVTAASITSRVPPPPAKKKAPVYIPSATLDAIGRIIPDAILPLWERGHEVQEIISLLQSAKNRIVKAEKENDPLFRALFFQRVVDALANALAELKAIKPYSLCAKCHGKLPEDCADCRETGLIGEFFWSKSVPEETRAMIKKTIKSNENSNYRF